MDRKTGKEKRARCSRSSRGLRSPLRDERGASIVIALLFFLICAIIGSVVLTAASVNAKAVQTNRDLQQTEFTVGSAAQLVGAQFSAMALRVDYASGDGVPVVDEDATDPQNAAFSIRFWSANADAVWQKRSEGSAYETDVTVDLQNSNHGMEGVAGVLTVDADLNVTVELGLAGAADGSQGDGAYRETVYVQCIPTYEYGKVFLSQSHLLQWFVSC